MRSPFDVQVTDLKLFVGMSIRRMLSGVDAVEHRKEVQVKLGWLGQCIVAASDADL